MPTLKIENFSGGKTDEYINAPVSYFKAIDNFLLNRNAKPFSRPGSEFYDIVLSPIPGDVQRVNHLKFHDNVLFEFAGSRAFYNLAGTLTEVLGPNDAGSTGQSEAFSVGSVDSVAALSTWQNHLLGTVDTLAGMYPRKIYRDQDGTVQIRSAGLPGAEYAAAFASILDLLAEFISVFNAHVGSVTRHNSADTPITIGLPTATYNEEELFAALEEARLLLTEHITEMLDIGTLHSGTAAQDLLQNPQGRINSMIEAVAFANDLKRVYNAHNALTAPHKTTAAGAAIASTATVDWTLLKSGGGLYTAGSNNYLFAFVFVYEYTVDDVQYTDRSAPNIQQIPSIAELIGTNIGYRFTAPNFDNGFIDDVDFATLNAWDTANWKVEVYRTTNNGSVFYLSNTFRYADVLSSKTVVFGDMQTDALLVNQPRLYTNGGILDNDLPPICKYIVVAGDVTWYLNVKEGNVTRPFRMRQSKLLDPDSCPEGLFVDLDAEITGGGVIREVPIIFTETKTYRVEGFVDAAGRGFVRPRLIAHDVGCLSHNSIVPTGDLLYFAGTDGFYRTDGFKVEKISNHLNASYKNLTAAANSGTPTAAVTRKRIFGKHDKLTGRIYWSVHENKALADNDTLYIHDPYYPIIDKKGTFTTWTFGTGGSPTSLEFVDDNLLRGDVDGYVFAHDDNLSTDMVVDTSEADETLWATQAVRYSLITAASNFGSEVIRKWVTKLIVVLKNISNLSLLPRSINDDASANAKDMKEIRFRNNVVWGDADIIWGDPDLYWNYTAMILAERRFPATHLRCTFKQVELTNSFTVIFRSDDLALVTTDTSANTVTLASGTWPADLLSYAIYFDVDDYATGYTILARTSDTVITVEDTLGELGDLVGAKWLIKGYRKNEKVQLENMSILYENFGSSLTGYAESEAGENVA